MKQDQERVSKLLTDTVTLLCKNGLVYSQEIKVQGLLGITLDKNDVFLVHINELIAGNVASVPSTERSATTASALSQSQAKKSTSGSSKVVDLTRVSDELSRPVPPQSLSSQAAPGLVAAGRKHRRPMVPATVMIAQEQSSPRMHHGPRPRRMDASPLKGSAASQMASNYIAQLQQQVAHGMSPHHQGVIPQAVGQKAVKRRLMSSPQPRQMTGQRAAVHDSSLSIASADGDVDNEDDVMIVGTGHEEPSPSWISPMRKRPLPSQDPSPVRKRPLPSRVPLSPLLAQKHSSSQPHQSSHQTYSQRSADPEMSGGHRPAEFYDGSMMSHIPSSVIEQLRDEGVDVAGTLELTAEDIPSSVEDMIMHLTPAPVSTPHKAQSRVKAAEMPAEVFIAPVTATVSEFPLTSVEGRPVVTQVVQPVTIANINATITSDAVIEAAVATVKAQPESFAENKLEDTGQSLQPLVYTDITCAVGKGEKAVALVDINAAGFDVETAGFDLETTTGFGMETAERFGGETAQFDIITRYDTGTSAIPAVKPSPSSLSVTAAAEWSCHTWYSCQALHCVFTCLDPLELAEHYTAVHSTEIDLILPAVLDMQPDTDSEGEEVDDADPWSGVACPFAGCGVRIASYPGLVMHHRRVHGKPLPGKQRRAIQTVYQARRLMEAYGSSNVPASTDVPHTMNAPSSTVVSTSGFVCPVGGCETQCSSRDDLIAHVHLSHELADVIQPVCKQEKDAN